MPESDKLLAVSRYFNVTLDYLMKEGEERPAASERTPDGRAPRSGWLPGVIICAGGILGLIVWGLLSIFDPAAANQIGASSAVRIDGNGIFLGLCAAAVAVGAVLLLKNTSKK